MSKKIETQTRNDNIPGLSALASIMKEVGILGFILIMLVAVFLWYGDAEQKRYFIDTFILLKNVQSNPFPFGIVVVSLVAANIMQHIYYTMRLDLAEKEAKRIGEERTKLQEALLEKGLKSSVTKKVKP